MSLGSPEKFVENIFSTSETCPFESVRILLASWSAPTFKDFFQRDSVSSVTRCLSNELKKKLVDFVFYIVRKWRHKRLHITFGLPQPKCTRVAVIRFQ